MRMCVYIYIYVYEGCFDKYISVATWPPQTKIPGSAPEYRGSKYIENLKKISQIKKEAHKNHDLELKHNK